LEIIHFLKIKIREIISGFLFDSLTRGLFFDFLSTSHWRLTMTEQTNDSVVPQESEGADAEEAASTPVPAELSPKILEARKRDQALAMSITHKLAPNLQQTLLGEIDFSCTFSFEEMGMLTYVVMTLADGESDDQYRGVLRSVVEEFSAARNDGHTFTGLQLSVLLGCIVPFAQGFICREEMDCSPRENDQRPRGDGAIRY
jgi:hypothetical protein